MGLQIGQALLEQPAGQAGLSVGAVVWLQGCVQGSSQVLGRGAPCSAAHGHAGISQGLCCAGADGSKLQGQHCTVRAQLSQLRLENCSIKRHPSLELLSSDSGR